MSNNWKCALIFLTVIGILIATVALYYHYQESENAFCNINERFNCETVYKSGYSYIFGIPVPLLGIFGYGAFTFLVLYERVFARLLSFSRKEYWGYGTLLALFMLAFQLFMTGLEIFVIKAYCVLCIGSQIVIIAVTAITYYIYRKEQSEEQKKISTVAVKKSSKKNQKK